MLADWKKEFFPVEAKDAINSELEALEHSLKKWQGLERLDEFSVWILTGSITDFTQEIFTFGEETCALCVRHSTEESYIGPECKNCSLYLVRGIACWESVNHMGRVVAGNSPWHDMTVRRDPKPMIQLIEQAIEIEKRNLK